MLLYLVIGYLFAAGFFMLFVTSKRLRSDLEDFVDIHIVKYPNPLQMAVVVTVIMFLLFIGWPIVATALCVFFKYLRDD